MRLTAIDHRATTKSAARGQIHLSPIVALLGDGLVTPVVLSTDEIEGAEMQDSLVSADIGAGFDDENLCRSLVLLQTASNDAAGQPATGNDVVPTLSGGHGE